MTYLSPDIIDDETTVAQGILGTLAALIPGFQPSEGGISTPLAESTAIAIATAITQLKTEAQNAYMGFGQAILNIPRIAAGTATAMSTWTLDTSDGFLIPAGTEVQAITPENMGVTFAVAQDVQVPAGTTVQGGVQLVAVEAGPDSNGAVGPATSDPLIDANGNGVASVTIDAPSAGGTDEEDPDAYAGRLADRAKRLHVLPVTPEDFAAIALDVQEYATAVALNRYDPANPGVESGGHITIVGRNASGDPVSAANQAALAAYFAAIELPNNVIVHATNPVYVDVAVTATITPTSDADQGAVQAAAEAAITGALDKATFDTDAAQPGGWAKPRSTAITVFDIAALIDDLDGVAKVTDVTVNAGTSVALPDPVSLPNLTSVDVTVQ